MPKIAAALIFTTWTLRNSIARNASQGGERIWGSWYIEGVRRAGKRFAREEDLLSDIFFAAAVSDWSFVLTFSALKGIVTDVFLIQANGFSCPPAIPCLTGERAVFSFPWLFYFVSVVGAGTTAWMNMSVTMFSFPATSG